MEVHANDGYNPVDEDVGQRGCSSAGNIPEGTSDGRSDGRVDFDATNRGFVGKEDELRSVPVENPVEKIVPEELDSNTVVNLPVKNGAFGVSIPCEVHSKDTLPISSSCSTSVASHATNSGYPEKTAASSVSLPTTSSHFPPPPPLNKVTTSSQLHAHRLISPIILSPQLPPLARPSLPLRNGEKSEHTNTSLSWNYTSTRDHAIHIPKESGTDSKTSAASEEVVDEDTEADVGTLPFPEADIIGGRCRVDSSSEEVFRLVSKCGRRHVFSKMSPMRRLVQYTRDIFTTMVDLEWKYHLVIWMASFSLTWVGFGILWWIITIIPNHDAIEDDDNGTDPIAWNASQTTNSTIYHVSTASASQLPVSFTCLEKVEDLTGAILFSIETQTTIGYGLRYIRSDCHPLAYLLFYVQILAGVCIAFFLSGVVFRKLSRPYGRSSTILFSRYAVIRLNDPGTDYCLEFRMGDVRKSHIIGTSIRALLVKDRMTSEGERIPLCQYPLNLDTQSSVTDSFVFMPWPVIVSHRIDCESPLWTVSRRSMHDERFEIIVMFEGVVESTGASTQFRTSYLPSEVVWGHRFASLPIHERVGCDGSTPSLVDFGNFDQTVPMLMDDRCAKDFALDRKRLLEAATAEHRKNGTAEHRKAGTAEHRKIGTAEHLKNGTAEQRTNGTAERRKTGTAEHCKTRTSEHRVHGTVERQELGPSGRGNTKAVNRTNTEVTEMKVKGIDYPFKIFSPEDLALRLQRRLQKRAKRRESVKPQPTNKTSIQGGLGARGQKVNKAYTF